MDQKQLMIETHILKNPSRNSIKKSWGYLMKLPEQQLLLRGSIKWMML